MGYVHVSPEYHVFKGDYGIGTKDVNVLDGYVNFLGNTAADGLISANVSAHLRYLGRTKVSECAEGLFEI